MVKRLLSVIILLPVVIALIFIGGWPFYLIFTAAVCLGAREFSLIFQKNTQNHPSTVLIVLGAALLCLSRAVWGFDGTETLVTLLMLAAMALFIFRRENGHTNAVMDFAITLTGILYVGWLGAFLISLQALPDGEWWLLTALAAAWIADGGAFFIGTKFGKHPLAPRISPKKSWEGYLGGILTATLFTPLIAFLWHIQTPAIQPIHGLVIGIVLGVLSPIGDLAISMIKRFFNVKDSGNLIPGHGGMLDRLDSLLWAGPISYLLIVWFLQ